VPPCEKRGRPAQGLGGGAIDRVTIEVHGKIAEHDTRVLGIAVLVGILSGHTEEPVNLVNAPAMADERGIELTEISELSSDDFTELIKVRIGQVEVAGTGIGPRNVPYLVGVWGHSFYMPFADHLAIFRYDDRPGMIGIVGSAFGEHGVNIVSAAVGAQAAGEEAVMALTTDGPVPGPVIDAIVAGEGFFVGRAVDL
jgi:D-3-phosphoglycerate dehydrogenase